jgi:hypothetical protein
MLFRKLRFWKYVLLQRPAYGGGCRIQMGEQTWFSPSKRSARVVPNLTSHSMAFQARVISSYNRVYPLYGFSYLSVSGLLR